MTKLLKRSKFFTSLIIIMNISSLVASQMPAMPMITMENPNVHNEDILKQIFNADGTLSYDALSSFLQDLEDGY